ncbi:MULTISPECIES: division/cell wall cluster transcriptional repressor MraZ [Pedobacter]|jgi:MraZ protein|uniref:Transcriptional regulator MraZ n=2 Tax=Pedobacter TaxID=84567 RepID=A0A127V6Z1_9SPHI|nr:MULTISPECIES: division/cell wall cluster transcriptional repressor MraZ [Pedobacter]QNK62956.1 division/cell wall cluster transcriptional repressor MraZ [Pedobacter sp. PAMC26386]AMP96995.1 Cell division protein MraZ [Pedobacter cryoconitis]KIO76261.1 cell division protein MraZ [Pedobacter lusitanus]MBB5623460.1 MraZ protein [Pedobacter cryoconitis]MBB5639355.1 MraZ protein [Pedobacter cryoconitis]
MVQLLGEFDCKLDTKGRMMVPSNLKKQLPNVEQEGLVINRGFEKHLVIYPKKVWEGIVEELSKLNQYEKKTREFIRFFTRGATELTLDASGRVNLPKSLLEFAGIDGEVILSCQFDKIELWSKTAYDNLLDSEPEDFANLAEEVMGNKNRGEDGK